MFIVLLTEKTVQIIYFVIKTHNFFIIFTFFCKNIERVKMTTIFKYFMFGKYGCLDTNARGCCMHVFLVFTIAPINIHCLYNGRWMVFVVMRMRESSLISKIWRTTPRKNVCACVNLTCNSIANLMRSRSERFRRLKMAVKRSDFIVRLYSQISSAKINMSF